MARLTYLDPEDLAPEDRPLLARPIALYRVLAHRPDVLRHVDAMGDWIRWRSAIDPRLRELAIVYVGLLTRSPFEYSHHVKIAFDFGASPEDIHALRALAAGDPAEIGERERLVLAATRELVVDGTLGDSGWKTMLEQLGQDATIDLVATVSYYAMVVRILAALEVDVEPEYLGYLEQYPMVERLAGSDA